MMRAGGSTICSVASASVMLWPIVKAVTIVSSRPRLPPSSSRPMMKSMWSGPMAMWWIPEAVKALNTAKRP